MGRINYDELNLMDQIAASKVVHDVREELLKYSRVQLENSFRVFPLEEKEHDYYGCKGAACCYEVYADYTILEIALCKVIEMMPRNTSLNPREIVDAGYVSIAHFAMRHILGQLVKFWRDAYCEDTLKDCYPDLAKERKKNCPLKTVPLHFTLRSGRVALPSAPPHSFTVLDKDLGFTVSEEDISSFVISEADNNAKSSGIIERCGDRYNVRLRIRPKVFRCEKFRIKNTYEDFMSELQTCERSFTLNELNVISFVSKILEGYYQTLAFKLGMRYGDLFAFNGMMYIVKERDFVDGRIEPLWLGREIILKRKIK